MVDERQQMLDTIIAEARYTAEMTGRGRFCKRVMAALKDVDRKAFVPSRYQDRAYDNGPLSIGYGQTISQPYIVALMTDLLDLTENCVVLEVGTGSGYQAAILSRLAKQVYSLERVCPLAEAASERFRKLGYNNIEVRCTNGYNGWREHAPFDGIIVTAAAEEVPLALLEQLTPQGRLVIPVGPPYGYQELKLITRRVDGQFDTRNILGVAFVPLIDGEITDKSDNSQ